MFNLLDFLLFMPVLFLSLVSFSSAMDRKLILFTFFVSHLFIAVRRISSSFIAVAVTVIIFAVVILFKKYFYRNKGYFIVVLSENEAGTAFLSDGKRILTVKSDTINGYKCGEIIRINSNFLL